MKLSLKRLFCVLLALSMLLALAACAPAAKDPTQSGVDTAEDTTATPEQPAPQADYKYVVIVGVDGAGAYFKEAKTPNLDEIFGSGAVTYNAITSTPSISAQCWTSLLHGVTPEFHCIDNGTADAQAYPADSEFPSVFRVIREQMPDAHLASFCNWAPINKGIIEENLNVHKENIGNDRGVIEAASNYVRDSVANGKGAPTLMFLQLDEADHAGHSYNFGSKTQLGVIKKQDRWIRELYDTYSELGLLEDTLFIVTADHGGNGTSHGGDSATEMNVMFAVAGKTVEQGTIGEMGIRDAASIVLHALALKQPETWTSRVPSGLFEGVVAGERPVYEWPEGDRAHENVPTPEAGSTGHISNFITDKTLSTYLTFDGDITDECGAATTSGGKLYFVEGYFGEAVSLPDGYVSVPGYAPGTDSFTVSLWLNTKGVTSDPAILSNKDWNGGSNPGYVLSLRSGDIKFNAGNGDSRMDSTVTLPRDFRGGWMHVTLVVDRTAGEIRIALDFGDFGVFAIPDSLKESSLDAFNVLNIGQDGTGAYSSSLSASVDEFMLFDGALTREDLAKLAEYYGK